MTSKLNPNELRLGNLVHVSDDITNLIFKQINPLNIHNLMYLTGLDTSPVGIEFEPIELDSEWFEKFNMQFEPNFSDNAYVTYLISDEYDLYLQCDVRTNQFSVFQSINFGEPYFIN